MSYQNTLELLQGLPLRPETGTHCSAQATSKEVVGRSRNGVGSPYESNDELSRLRMQHAQTCANGMHSVPQKHTLQRISICQCKGGICQTLIKMGTVRRQSPAASCKAGTCLEASADWLASAPVVITAAITLSESAAFTQLRFCISHALLSTFPGNSSPRGRVHSATYSL